MLLVILDSVTTAVPGVYNKDKKSRTFAVIYDIITVKLKRD